MTCKNNECRAELPDDAVFCLKCGTKQDSPSFTPTTENVELDLECETQQSKTSKKTSIKALVIITVSIAVIAVLALIGWCFHTYNNTYMDPITYPMERCPITVSNITLTTDEDSKKSQILVDWSYKTNREEITIDKVIFSLTVSDPYGRVDNTSNSLTIKGPLSNDTSYQDFCSVSEEITSAEIKKIQIYYSDKSVEEYVEVTYEPDLTSLKHSPVQVTEVFTTSPNSAGGVDLILYWKSTSTKTIKYIYIYVTPYNRVGDVESSNIGGKTTSKCKLIGPYNSGDGGRSTFENVWYNSSISSARIEKIEIEYNDGTSEIYD